MAKKNPLDGLRVPIADEIASLERERKETEKHNADLKARSKPLHELVQTAYFTVASVVSQSRATQIHPSMRDIPIGPASADYSPSPAGYTSELVLKVTSDDKDVPVEELTFHGHSAVRTGDSVRALIPRFSGKEEKRLHARLPHHPPTPVYNIDRPYHKKESAIELVIIEEDKEVRTDRSVDYSRFVRK